MEEGSRKQRRVEWRLEQLHVHSFLPERQLTVSGGATPTRKKEGQVTDCHFAGNKDTCSRYFLTYSLSHQSSGQHMDHFSEGDLGSFFQKDKNPNDNTNII